MSKDIIKALRAGDIVGIDPNQLRLVGARNRKDLSVPLDTDHTSHQDHVLYDDRVLRPITIADANSKTRNPLPVGDWGKSGIFSPVHVVIDDDGVPTVAMGRGRVLAMRLANEKLGAKQVVPCILLGEGAAANELVAVENIARDEADGYDKLMYTARFLQQGYESQEDLAELLNMSGPQAGKYKRIAKWYLKHVETDAEGTADVMTAFKSSEDQPGIPVGVAATSKGEDGKYVFALSAAPGEVKTWIKTYTPKKKGAPKGSKAPLPKALQMKRLFRTRDFSDLINMQGMWAEHEDGRKAAQLIRATVFKDPETVGLFWEYVHFDVEAYEKPENFLNAKACDAVNFAAKLLGQAADIRKEINDAAKAAAKAEKEAAKEAEKAAKAAAKAAEKAEKAAAE